MKKSLVSLIVVLIFGLSFPVLAQVAPTVSPRVTPVKTSTPRVSPSPTNTPRVPPTATKTPLVTYTPPPPEPTIGPCGEEVYLCPMTYYNKNYCVPEGNGYLLVCDAMLIFDKSKADQQTQISGCMPGCTSQTAHTVCEDLPMASAMIKTSFPTKAACETALLTECSVRSDYMGKQKRACVELVTPQNAAISAKQY